MRAGVGKKDDCEWSFLPTHRVGLGLRREFLFDWPGQDPSVHFLEIAPENWIGVGGRRRQRLDYFREQYPFVCHGLSLSLGGIRPFDPEYLYSLAAFLLRTNALCYSEHLSFCDDEKGYLYELLPPTMTLKNARRIAGRISEVQDTLKRRIAVENSTYYALPAQEMSEQEFLLEILKTADCELLLDVNNVYVNAHNHGYDACTLIHALPTEKIAYLHIAGHERDSEHRFIDTHGAAVTSSVWDLLSFTYQCHGLKPTLLERDNHVPPIKELLSEVSRIHSVQQHYESSREHNLANPVH